MKSTNPKELPPGSPRNVLTLPWIPQLDILDRKNIRAFMTHGGQMGIVEAIWYGLPMIGLTFVGDQSRNIKLFANKHVAVYLDHKQLTTENLNAAFNAVPNDPSHTRAVKKSSAVFRGRPTSAMDTAVFWVEYIRLRHSGANLRSSAMHLTRCWGVIKRDEMRVLRFVSLLAIAANMSPGEAYRILGVFPHSSKSHFMMYGALSRGLAERGHQVDVVSHFPPKKPIPNYNQIVDLSGTVPSMTNNLTYGYIKANRETALLAIITKILGSDLCELMDQPEIRQLVKNPPKDPPYDLLITDICASICYLALGQHLKVPIVGTVSAVLWPWVNDMVANPENPAYIPSVFSGFSGRMTFWQRMINVLELMQEKWEFNRDTAYQDEQIKKYIGPHAPGVREAERNVSLILTNSHYSLNGVRPYSQAVVEVGGLHIPENSEPLPKDLEEWLNDSVDGVVYMSFGSMTKIESFPKETLIALYASIRKLSPIRVLMKIANPGELPPGLPANVLTYRWIPQTAVLKHKNIRAFLSHGGLVSTMEAVYYEVPMIIVPLFGDQAQNMKLYVEKHVAVSLDEGQLTEENLDAAFNVILNDPSYRKAAKKLSAEFRDRPMSPMDTAIFWVEYVIRHGGANLRSPAMDLSWWQIALLDVYGALLLATVLSLYLLKHISLKLWTVVAKSYFPKVASFDDKKVK